MAEVTWRYTGGGILISVYFGIDSSAVYKIDNYFEDAYLPEWFDDEIVKQMVKDVDLSTVVSRQCITSPVLGQIPVSMLSGGVKALILLWKLDDIRIDLVACGENCMSWLSYIQAHKDIKVSMSGYDLTFVDDAGNDLPISGICENDNSEIENAADWREAMCMMAGDWNNRR